MHAPHARRRGRTGERRCLAVIAVTLLAVFEGGCADRTRPEESPAVPSAVSSFTPALGSIRVRRPDGMSTVYVPEGVFRMGSDYLAAGYARELCKQYVQRDVIAACSQSNFRDEAPAHEVSISAFWIDQTEVSNGQYQKCELADVCEPPAERGSHYRTSYYGDAEFADYPVIFVTREQGMRYCEWAGARLPTEAEWEYAARGPKGSIFPWGDAFDGTRLNYCDLNCDAGPRDATFDDAYSDTAPVGSFPNGASWIGALDMAGNVREWVADWYGSYAPDPQVDPRGPDQGDLVVPRGGSWIDNPSIVRSANRGGNTPDYYRDYYGFRCAAD